MVLLYADDMVLISIKELHDLRKLHIYCSQWTLKVNPENLKSGNFGDKSRDRGLIIFNNLQLEETDCFKYLRVVLSKSRTFQQTKTEHIVDQGGLYMRYRDTRYLSFHFQG